MKFHSPEYYEAVKAISLTDKAWRDTARGFTCRWQALIKDIPDGTDRLIEWETRNTKLTDVKWYSKPAPSEWRTMPVDESKFLGRFVGPYWAVCRLHKQEITAMMAIGMEEYDIVGDVTEVIRKIESFDAFIDLQSTIPCEY